MANNYLEFSEQIVNLTDEEIAWLEQQLDTVYFKRVPGPNPEQEVLEIAPNADEDTYEQEGVRFLVEAAQTPEQFQAICDLDEVESTGFCFALNKSERTLWLYAEEHGHLGHVAVLVQQFLKKFRRNESFSVTAADWCSKPRLGQFGGAALFITAEEVRSIHTWMWLEDQQKAFDDAKRRVVHSES
jgi:hypothetical protein